MENSKNFYSNASTWWKRFGKYVFCALSVTTAILVGTLVNCDKLLLILAIISALLVYFRLRFAICAIKSRFTRLAWAGVDFSLFMLICQLCAMKPAGTYAGYPYDTHLFGMLFVLFANTILYAEIPKLTRKMGIAKVEKNEWGEKSNYYILSCIIYFVMGFIVLFVEKHQMEDYLFEKQPFVNVISWEKEVFDRNTVYVVETEDGTLVIDPFEYPEIRNINLRTQIKIHPTKSYYYRGVHYSPEVEIKN